MLPREQPDRIHAAFDDHRLVGVGGAAAAMGYLAFTAGD